MVIPWFVKNEHILKHDVIGSSSCPKLNNWVLGHESVSITLANRPIEAPRWSAHQELILKSKHQLTYSQPPFLQFSNPL